MFLNGSEVRVQLHHLRLQTKGTIKQADSLPPKLHLALCGTIGGMAALGTWLHTRVLTACKQKTREKAPRLV